MSDQAQYRFLPWARRGLAGAIVEPVSGAVLPQRAKISVGITVTNAGTSGVDLGLYGPGDVLGIDPRLIVRASPRAGSTDVETNYFAALEFDPPDFPWMFTPARADAQERLQPWLVLVVFDLARVAPPKAGRLKPLPTVMVRAEVAAQELPDLSESWAWAHGQAMVEQGSSAPLARELKAHPALNVSRLLCPRRLEAHHNYVACLVPAFDAGVIRGLGGTPDPKTALGPAWSSPPGAVELPVYYHWEFATGPLGDFESLARKLRPFKCPESVGVAEMYIGDGNPVIAVIGPEEETARTLMDGALRAPKRGDAKLDDIVEEIREGLARALNAPAEILAGGPPDATPVLGPPIYGEWHARQHTITTGAATWLRELNLDPRARVAAGLGAEVVRRWQEDFMHEAWEQVGEILKASERLSWGRLSLEANLRAFIRHVRTLPADRLLTLAAALHGRTARDGQTIYTRIRTSSLPNGAADPALRRITSPQRPLLKHTVHRLRRDARLAGSFATTGRSTLIPQLATGRLAVDPTRFLPDGLVRSITFDSAALIGTRPVLDLTDAGLPVKISASQLNLYQQSVAPLRDVDFQTSPLQVAPRTDLRVTGIITRTHIENVVALQLAAGDPVTAVTDVQGIINQVLRTSAEHRSSKGLLLTVEESGATTVEPLDIGARGGIVVRRNDGTLREVGSVSTDVMAGGVNNVMRALGELPIGTLSNTAAVTPAVSTGASGELQVRGHALETDRISRGGLVSPGSVRRVVPVGPRVTDALTAARREPVREATREPTVVTPPTRLPTNTVPMPVIAADIVMRYEETLRAALVSGGFNVAVDSGRFVGFDLAAARTQLIERVNPAITVPRRMLHMLDAGGRAITAATDRGIFVTPLLDRIMAAPDLPAPTYRYLAEYDQERFVPGIGVIPPDSITLLETNPRFIEGFMVGINYEMNRELLWRRYPTDQRGTPFRYFWQWLDGGADIPQIHSWTKASTLGSHARGAGAGGQIVMLLRGALARRYPNAVLLAWKAKPDHTAITVNPADVKLPVFQGRLEPDVIFAGFDLVDADLTTGAGWFFIVQEQPTEPRFGFDLPENGTGTLARWSDASWAHTGVNEGGYLRMAGNPLLNQTRSGFTFGRNAAHMASITLQQPMRVAVHGKHLIIE